jgi:hypothetical protein
MVEDHGWMYGGWKKGGAHTKEWMNKTQEFINHALCLSNNNGVKCPCGKCRNVVCEDKKTLILQFCKIGFMPGYEVSRHHGELVRQTTSVVEDDDRRGDNRMDDMLDAIRSELETNPEDPPTLEVPGF